MDRMQTPGIRMRHIALERSCQDTFVNFIADRYVALLRYRQKKFFHGCQLGLLRKFVPGVAFNFSSFPLPSFPAVPAPYRGQPRERIMQYRLIFWWFCASCISFFVNTDSDAIIDDSGAKDAPEGVLGATVRHSSRMAKGKSRQKTWFLGESHGLLAKVMAKVFSAKKIR